MKLKERLYFIIAKLGIQFCSKIFPEYFAQDTLAPTDRYIETPFVIKNLPNPPARILDVGCSGSFFPLLLPGLGYDTFAIDLRDYAILHRLKFENFIFVKGDIRKTQFENEFFDAVTAISTVEHIGIPGRYGMDEDADGDKKAITEIKRILKPQGLLLLTVPFGKARVFKPYSKIYDSNWLRRLTTGFKIDLESYYCQDSNDDWHSCLREDAEKIEPKFNRFALCLLKLIKE